MQRPSWKKIGLTAASLLCLAWFWHGHGISQDRLLNQSDHDRPVLSFADIEPKNNLPRVLPSNGQVQVAPEGQLPAPSVLASERTATPLFIDLATALRLAETQNPLIGLSRQAIEEALARQLQVRALMLPTVHAGGNYRLHTGEVQSSPGVMRSVDLNSLYFGNGALANGTQTVIVPGVQVLSHLGDALFEPLAARQFVNVRRFQSQATVNEVFLAVCSRFLDLVAAQARLEALRLSEKDMKVVKESTAAFAQLKQGREADALRALTELLLLEDDILEAEEGLSVASTELTRVLSLEAVSVLHPLAMAEGLIELIDPSCNLEDLVREAVTMRPELAALRSEIARKQIQVRQERTRPFFPTLVANFSAGSFGGGAAPTLSQFGNRTDFDVIAYWTLENLGVGNLARQKERRSEQNQAVLEMERMHSQVRREVAEALAVVELRRQDLEIARQRLALSQKAYQQDLGRTRNIIGLPIELLNSLNRLIQAREDIVRIVQQYNIAQFQLFTALGRTPTAEPKGP